MTHSTDCSISNRWIGNMKHLRVFLLISFIAAGLLLNSRETAYYQVMGDGLLRLSALFSSHSGIWGGRYRVLTGEQIASWVQGLWEYKRSETSLICNIFAVAFSEMLGHKLFTSNVKTQSRGKTSWCRLGGRNEGSGALLESVFLFLCEST